MRQHLKDRERCSFYARALVGSLFSANTLQQWYTHAGSVFSVYFLFFLNKSLKPYYV